MYLKKLRRAEGGAKIFGIFRVKNHDFTPKNLIFSNFRWGHDGGAPPLSNLSSLSVPDECYSSKASCALNLISTFLLELSVHVFVIS